MDSHPFSLLLFRAIETIYGIRTRVSVPTVRPPHEFSYVAKIPRKKRK
jgi:hypothetical protein